MALFDNQTPVSFIAVALAKGKEKQQQAVPLARLCTCGRMLDFYRQGPQIRAWCAPCGRTLRGRPWWAHADFTAMEIEAMPEWDTAQDALPLAVATADTVDAPCRGIGVRSDGCANHWSCYAAQKCAKNEWPPVRVR